MATPRLKNDDTFHIIPMPHAQNTAVKTRIAQLPYLA